MPEGTYRIADRIIKICSVYESVQKFCADYTCAGEPFLTVRTDENDIRAEQLKSAREAAYEGRETLFYPEDYLETLAVYRKLVTAMASDGVLLMHGSAAAVDGQAYLFTAKSGTGKSTHSRLWLQHVEGSALLNDDNPIVRLREDGSIWVYGSPWSGKTSCYVNKGMPVGAIVKLAQAPENRIRRCTLPESYAALYSSVSGLKMNRKMYDGLHETMEKTVVSVPFYHLDCLPDADAAMVCSKTIVK